MIWPAGPCAAQLRPGRKRAPRRRNVTHDSVIEGGPIIDRSEPDLPVDRGSAASHKRSALICGLENVEGARRP
jgi:hypothetical protein